MNKALQGQHSVLERAKCRLAYTEHSSDSPSPHKIVDSQFNLISYNCYMSQDSWNDMTNKGKL